MSAIAPPSLDLDRQVEQGSRAAARLFDFRRPTGYPREAVRNFAALHELFARQMSRGWRADLRTMVTFEEVAVEQVTFEDVVVSLPNPSVIATFSIDSGVFLVDFDIELALLLIDRLLGGGAVTTVEARRLTAVEVELLTHLLRHVADGVAESLSPVAPTEPKLVGIEFNPQLVQVAAPSDRVVMLSYEASVSQSGHTRGLVNVSYLASTVQPLLDRITWAGDPNDSPRSPVLAQALQDIDVELHAKLRPSRVPAAVVASLQAGDVLTLDHRVDEPVTLTVEGRPVFTGHIGRRGTRAAVQIGAVLDDVVPQQKG